MTDMVERVARAIYEGRNGHGAVPWSRRDAAHKAPYLADARAAIEAMREPDDFMLKRAFAAMNETPGGEWNRLKASGLKHRELFDAKMVPRWRAMIDAALSAEGEKG